MPARSRPGCAASACGRQPASSCSMPREPFCSSLARFSASLVAHCSAPFGARSGICWAPPSAPRSPSSSRAVSVRIGWRGDLAAGCGGWSMASRQKAGGSSLSCASCRSCRSTSSITRSVSPASRSAAMSSPRPSACCRAPSPTPGSAMQAGRPPRETARLCATAFSDLE